MTASELIAEAERARQFARAAQSDFAVGAALETAGGSVFSGCNVESATYGLTVCAERVAVWKALSEGNSEFVRIAVVADTAALTPPCGACRQVLWEYCGDIEVILSNLEGKRAVYRLSKLLPVPFDGRMLRQRPRKALGLRAARSKGTGRRP
jgi:cytidine deaminase